MIKRITTIASLGVLSLASNLAAAESDAYGYVGAGYGQYKFKFEDSRTNQDFSDKNDLGKIFVGVQSNDVIGAELTYLAFSDAKDKAIQTEIKGVSAAITAGIPFGGRLAIRARGGWLMWEADYKVANLPLKGSTDGGDFFVGVGVELGLTESLDIRVDYDRYELDEDIDPQLDIVSISAQLAF